MAIDYTYWNNGIKNNTFYPLGYNACNLFGVGEYHHWPWSNCDSIKNNKVYTDDSTTNYSLFDSAAWKGKENSNYTVYLWGLNGDIEDTFSVYLPYAKGEMKLDKDDFAGSLKINAPLIDNFTLSDSSADRNPIKSLTLNLKNAGSIDFEGGSIENETKISGTNLEVINFQGVYFNDIKINAPNLVAINFSGGTINGEMEINASNLATFDFSGGTINGEMKMKVNENCNINISGGYFYEGIFSGMPLTNASISGGTFDVVNPDPDELQKLDDYQLSFFIGYVACSQWALKTFLDSLKVAFPNGGKEIVVGYFMDTEDEWNDMKTQYSAAGFTLMTQDEYFENL